MGSSFLVKSAQRHLVLEAIEACGSRMEKMLSLWAQHPDNSYTSNPPERKRTNFICRRGTKAFFMAYTAMFDQFRIRFPFSDFQIEVLHNLHLAPSQLHPSGWAFVQAFEVFCWANEWKYSSNLFLYLFGLYRGSSIWSWVSVLHRKNVTQMFIPWDDSVKVRRDLYVKVIPKKNDFVAFWENANREPFSRHIGRLSTIPSRLLAMSSSVASLMMMMKELLTTYMIL
jgi:hypothetical protein